MLPRDTRERERVEVCVCACMMTRVFAPFPGVQSLSLYSLHVSPLAVSVWVCVCVCVGEYAQRPRGQLFLSLPLWRHFAKRAACKGGAPVGGKHREITQQQQPKWRWMFTNTKHAKIQTTEKRNVEREAVAVQYGGGLLVYIYIYIKCGVCVCVECKELFCSLSGCLCVCVCVAARGEQIKMDDPRWRLTDWLLTDGESLHLTWAEQSQYSSHIALSSLSLSISLAPNWLRCRQLLCSRSVLLAHTPIGMGGMEWFTIAAAAAVLCMCFSEWLIFELPAVNEIVNDSQSTFSSCIFKIYIFEMKQVLFLYLSFVFLRVKHCYYILLNKNVLKKQYF